MDQEEEKRKFIFEVELLHISWDFQIQYSLAEK